MERITAGSIPCKILNVMAMFRIGAPVDLADVGRRAWNTEYDRSRGDRLTMRMKEPKATARIFRSGTVLVWGAKSEADSLLASRKFASILRRLSYGSQINGWRVTNMVGVITLPFPVNLTMLACSRLMPYGRFEPEIQPAAFAGRTPDPETTFKVFASGTIVFTGFTERNQLDVALDRMLPILQQFRIEEQLIN